MASGIKVSEEVKEIFQKVNMTTAKATKYKYAILKYTPDQKFIIVEEQVPDSPDETYDYDSIISKLPPKEPRFLIYDFDHLDNVCSKKTDVIIISWCPNECPVRFKLIQGSSINGLKAALNIKASKFIESDCYSDITSAAINERFKWPVA